MFRNLLTGAAVIALISGATAQQKQQMNVQKASVNPIFAGVYHPSTGLVSGNGNTVKSGPEVIYNNNALSGYYSVPGANQEWVDNGMFADRNSDSAEQVNGFNFTYCSSAPNAVDNVIRFYDESVYCGGPVNWPVADCAYGFPGLPGSLNGNGNLTCWIVTVDLCGVECDLTTDPNQSRSFGWSSTWNESTTGPWIANGGAGQTDSFTWWDTLAANANSGLVGCFWFGGTPWAGFAMVAMGNPVETMSHTSATPGADDSLCLSLDVSAQQGVTVNFSVTDAAGNLAASTLWVSATSADLDLSGAFGIDAHLLADYASRVLESSSATGVHPVTVPMNPLATGVWYSQAATGAAGVPSAMSNALVHNVF